MVPYLIFLALGCAIGFAVTRSPIATAINGVIGFVLAYLALPQLQLDHIDPYLMLLALTALPMGWAFALDQERRAGLTAGVAAGGFAFLLLAMFVTSASIFHAGSYARLIGEVEQVDKQALTARMETFDQTQARFVDQGLAENRAEELLGIQTGLASRVTVATPSIQSVDGRLGWIGALEHVGFKKWSSNDHTPGYYRIDQTSRQDAEMVLEHDMRVMPSAFFGQDLDRAIYEAGYWNVAYTDNTLEVDDNGKPFWVVSLYEHKVGFMGSDATGVLVVDPATGETTEYGIEDAPSWIDRVHPAAFLETQLSDWGIYRHGWWNAFWAESEPTMDTTAGKDGEAGLYFVRAKDGTPAWYTGMQSTQADRGTQGYTVVDARTKQATYYGFAGVTEQAIQEALLGAVAEKEGYSVTYPIPYNVNGHLTHVAVLKDQTGNPQLYGMASASNRDWKVVGETPRAALRAFNAELRQQNYAQNLEGPAARKAFSGPVARIGHEVSGGDSTYYLTLVTLDGKAFRVPAAVSVEVPLTRIGDEVRIEVYETEAAVLEAAAFDNTGIELEKSAGQLAVEQHAEETRQQQADEATRKRFEQLREDLSPEEMRRMLEEQGAK